MTPLTTPPPEPEWQDGLAALELLVQRGWRFRTTGPTDRPFEPTGMLAERATACWIDIILIDGHDQAEGMRYEMQQTPRRPLTEKVLRHTDGALAEVAHRVLGWPADRQ